MEAHCFLFSIFKIPVNLGEWGDMVQKDSWQSCGVLTALDMLLLSCHALLCLSVEE